MDGYFILKSFFGHTFKGQFAITVFVRCSHYVVNVDIEIVSIFEKCTQLRFVDKAIFISVVIIEFLSIGCNSRLNEEC